MLNKFFAFVKRNGLAFLLLGLSQPVLAFELGAGFSAAEEGDDRMRPAAHLHLGIGESFFSRLYLYGRKFGPIIERTTLFSSNYRFLLANGSNFSASVGAVGMMEQTSIEAGKTQEKVDDRQYNFGAAFGLNYRIPVEPLLMHISWDSHLFLAGQAAIFLVTGRKQTISLTMGIDL